MYTHIFAYIKKQNTGGKKNKQPKKSSYIQKEGGREMEATEMVARFHTLFYIFDFGTM